MILLFRAKSFSGGDARQRAIRYADREYGAFDEIELAPYARPPVSPSRWRDVSTISIFMTTPMIVPAPLRRTGSFGRESGQTVSERLDGSQFVEVLSLMERA